LESDLRFQHLSLEVTRTRQNAYGVVYEVEGPITTPNGRTFRFCSVWQVDTGTDVPRFITMYPRHIAPGVAEEGYSVEFFDMTGNTVAAATLPASALRLPTRADRPAVRALSA
jgi:hypothetical protein